MDETIPKQSFHLRDLPAKSVTLYPSRAHIVREINDVTLQPGQNEIEIYGLGPMAEENSIQIEGTGQASITDITVDLIPNRDDYFDFYPDELGYSDSEDDMSEPEDSESEVATVNELAKKIKDLIIKIEEQEDSHMSAETQLQSLNTYFNNCHTKESNLEPGTLASSLKTYDEERARLYKVKGNALLSAKLFQKEKLKLEYQKSKASKDERKKKQRLAKEKYEAKQKKARQRAEKRKEKNRVREERQKFWPNKVYRVVVRLETAIDTPGPSRRGSLDSITLAKATPESLDKIVSKGSSNRLDASLTLKYITNSAFWTPRYDLNISSLNKSATIVYRAELSNGTSETFKDAKVVLSTSQTSYSGLDDKPPSMAPWHVSLQKAYAGQNVDALSNINISASIQQKEAAKKSKRAHMGYNNVGSSSMQQQNQLQRPQAPYVSSLFGPGPSANLPSGQMPMAAPPPPAPAFRHMPSASRRAVSASVVGGGLFGTSRGGGGFGGGPVASAALAQPTGALESRLEAYSGDVSFDVSEESLAEGEGGLDFEESNWEDSGLTATYELPGTRTISPSSTARRHKIATLQATNVLLSHISIPKLRAAAFLRAKMKNPSGSVTLLKGNAGVTLDGSFLGTIPLPRVSPNQLFTIPLGVDPAIHINYPKPTVHRSTQGIFSKESAHVFNRSIYVTNTKPMPIELLVLDQVPVSQDERLRIDILSPRGLSKEGDAVKTGLPGNDAKGNWGKAVVIMKKAGEVSWTANIEKGAACILKFDYEARLPTSESVLTIS